MQTPQLKNFLSTPRKVGPIDVVYSAWLPYPATACIGDVSVFGEITIRLHCCVGGGTRPSYLRQINHLIRRRCIAVLDSTDYCLNNFLSCR